MHTQSNDVQALKNPAPRNASFENVARKMSSREIAEVTQKRHDNVWRTIESLHAKGLIGLPQFEEVSNPGPGPLCLKQYLIGKRDSFVVVAQLSPEFTAALVDRWQELEQSQGRVIATLPDFSNPAAAARAWAEQFELQQAANQALAIAAPKVEFVDKYVESTGLKGFRQTAKLLGANEARFREFLLDRRIMYRMGGEWQAYQNHVDAGRFQVKTGTSDAGHAFNQAKFTPKGVNWIAGLWAQYKLEAQ
ncbi:phage antirepressor protein [Pseudomonas syringae pv. tomato]|uniref:phage antirepressor KilAC domain-containing protein n=1 Tax=Pseudomonas syringae group genomosp. 3 TaxID=251701 RepID=UPI0010689503|nr:phage antirepressor KilAC domain-containing protein [Pseudomonas syringae group genomosp. 3]TES59169.1 phage antirepressor protein [Pseudomonas syringae pv. tomato]